MSKTTPKPKSDKYRWDPGDLKIVSKPTAAEAEKARRDFAEMQAAERAAKRK